MEEVFKIVWAGSANGVPFGPLLIGNDFYNEDDAKRFMKELANSPGGNEEESYFKIDKFFKRKNNAQQ